MGCGKAKATHPSVCAAENLLKSTQNITRPPPILSVNREFRARTLPCYEVLHHDDDPIRSPLCYIKYKLDSIQLDEVSDILNIPKDR